MIDFLTNINLKKNSLTKNELKACEAIMENLLYVQKYTFTELSEKIGITKASILRFCQKIGYSGYNEFKFDCIRYVNSTNNIANREHSENSTSISRITKLYCDVLPLIENMVTEKQIYKLISMIKNARRIFAIGIVNSAVIARQIRYAFLMFGISIEVIDSVEHLKSIDLTLANEDLLIVISVSSKSDIVRETFKTKENINFKTCLITMNGQSPFLEDSDHYITLPSVSSLKTQSLLDSIPVYSVFIEILIYYFSSKNC